MIYISVYALKVTRADRTWEVSGIGAFLGILVNWSGRIGEPRSKSARLNDHAIAFTVFHGCDQSRLCRVVSAAGVHAPPTGAPRLRSVLFRRLACGDAHQRMVLSHDPSH